MSIERARRLRRKARKELDKATEIKQKAERTGTWDSETEEHFEHHASRAERFLNEAEEIEKDWDQPIVGARSSRGFETRGGTAMSDVRVGKDWTGRSHFAEYLRGQRPAYEVRAGQQTIGSSGQGGVVVPDELQTEIFEIAKSFDGLRNTRVTVEQTDNGRKLAFPGVDDTENTASIVNEGSTIAGTTGVDFTAIESEPVSYRSGPVKISWELVQDASIDIVSFISEKLGTRIGRAVSGHHATRSSTNASGPHGITTATTGAVAIAGSSELTLANLRSLYFSIDPAWRPRAEWAISDDALQTIWGLTDDQSRPLVQQSNMSGEPNRLFGKVLHPIADLPSVDSTGSISVLFGDLSAYMVRDVAGMRMLRLEERYAEEGNLGVLSFSRHDAKPLFSSTYAATKRPFRGILTKTT